MSSQLSSLLFLVVGISMALTPWLAAGGQLIASRFEQHDVRSLLPVESEVNTNMKRDFPLKVVNPYRKVFRHSFISTFKGFFLGEAHVDSANTVGRLSCYIIFVEKVVFF